MRRKNSLLFFVLCFYSACLNAQDITNFTQFFINPYSINPSYAGIEGRSALFLSYRKQWANIDGAPSIGSLTFHTPTAFGLNYGVNFTNDTRGILKTSSAMLTAGYTLTLDKHNFIRFGISAGAAFNGVDSDEFPLANPGDPDDPLNDPVLAKALDKNMFMVGNVGLSVHLKSVHFGASLPNIFTPAFVSTDAFSMEEVKPFQSVIIHASNRFYLAKDKHVFEPYLVYRINDGLPSQLEAAAVMHLNHAAWFGASYKQDFGISALGGLKFQNFFLIGGSYSLKNTGMNELNSPSFEIQLSYIFGAKKKDVPLYSFVNTVKEKEKRKTPAQLAAEKKRAEEEKKKRAEEEKKKQELAVAKKKEEELAKKQADEQKRQQEELAKKQAEEQKRQQALANTTPPPKKDSVVVEPVKRHDGGPRLKSEILVADLPNYDTAHHEEQARIALIDTHAADPDEHHGEDTDLHPNAERHEFVKRGGHHEELEIGDYVIAGVFKSDANADHYTDGLIKLGFTADYGHLTERNLWYVYIAQTNDINMARAERDKFRKMKIFKDAWLLTVHH